MSTFEDLERYEWVRFEVKDQRQIIARKNFAKGRIKVLQRSADSNTRRAWLNEDKREKPSLPRVKWLERPDP